MLTAAIDGNSVGSTSDATWVAGQIGYGTGQGVTAQFDNLSITSAGGSTGPTGEVRGAGSNRCLDVNGASQADGAVVQIWDCNGGANQRWTLTSSNQLTVYGNKCLDVPGTSSRHPRTNLELQRRDRPAVASQSRRHHRRCRIRTVPRCQRRRHRQRHRGAALDLQRRQQPVMDPQLGRESRTQQPGTWLECPAPRKALSDEEGRDMRSISRFAGRIALAAVVGLLVTTAIPPGRASADTAVTIVGGQSGRCVDVPNASTTNGTQVQLWDCSGASDQPWTYTSGQTAARCTATSVWTRPGGARATAPRSSSGTATVRPTSSGTSTPTAPSPVCSRGCAWTPTAPPRPTARSSSSGPATARATSSGASRARHRHHRAVGPVRHLRRRRHAVRGRAQHRARALRTPTAATSTRSGARPTTRPGTSAC